MSTLLEILLKIMSGGVKMNSFLLFGIFRKKLSLACPMKK